MAGKKDTVWVADKVIVELQGAMATKVAEINAEYGDGVEITDIPEAHYGITEVIQPIGFPLMYVIPENANALPPGGEIRYGIEYHRLTVAVAVVGNQDPDDLKRQASRYIRAAQDIMIDERTLSCSVTDVLVVSKNLSPLIFSEDGLMQEAQMVIQVQTME